MQGQPCLQACLSSGCATPVKPSGTPSWSFPGRDLPDNDLVLAKIKNGSRKFILVRDSPRLCTCLSTVTGRIATGIFPFRRKNLVKHVEQCLQSVSKSTEMSSSLQAVRNEGVEMELWPLSFLERC